MGRATEGRATASPVAQDAAQSHISDLGCPMGGQEHIRALQICAKRTQQSFLFNEHR